jgi:hypothetical protein
VGYIFAGSVSSTTSSTASWVFYRGISSTLSSFGNAPSLPPHINAAVDGELSMAVESSTTHGWNGL